MTTLQPLWQLGYGQQMPFSNRRHEAPGALAGRRDYHGGALLIVTGDMCSGHSGGPWVNASGEVIGWSSFSLYDPVGGGLIESSGGLHAVRPIHEALPKLQAIAGQIFARRWNAVARAFHRHGLELPNEIRDQTNLI